MKYRVKIFRESYLVDFALSDQQENNPSMEKQPDKSYALYDKADGYIFNSLSAVKKYYTQYYLNCFRQEFIK